MGDRVGVWCAVSSEPQAERASLAEQEQAGRAYAKTIGGEVARVYRIPGHSRDIWNWAEAERLMPAYRQLREDVEGGAIDVLWCYDPDRLGRDPALAQAVASLTNRHGVDLYVDSGGYRLDAAAAPQRFVFSMQSTQSGVEQTKRKYRHKFGMDARIKSGLPNAQWPYGYRPVHNLAGDTVGGEFEPAEIGGMRLATRLFLQGAGYPTITKALNGSVWRPRRAAHWAQGTVYGLLNNAFYAGYCRRDGVGNEEPSDKYPLLWDADTWRAVQAEHRRRKRGGKPAASPVSGVAYCARCGLAMVASGHYKDGDSRFRCTTHREEWVTGVGCHPNTTKESLVIEAVEAFLAELRRLPGLLDRLVAESLPEERKLREEIEAADAELAGLVERQRRLALAVGDGTISDSAARLADQEYTRRIRAVESTRLQARHELGGLPDFATRRRQLAKALEVVSLRDRDLEEARSALIRAGIKVMVDDGKVVEIRLF
jgi:DNA invertase Pin-like site-specific DNA recombinase